MYRMYVVISSSSRLSDGNFSLLDEGGSALQVPQASAGLAGYGSVVWPDSLSEWLVDVLLFDCQYRKDTDLYSQCRVWNTGDS